MKLQKTLITIDRLSEKKPPKWVLIGLAVYFVWCAGEVFKQ
jgi:hypothetical protein